MFARFRLVGAETILDYVATRNYTIFNLKTLASFGQNAPPKYIIILRWQSALVVDELSVFG